MISGPLEEITDKLKQLARKKTMEALYLKKQTQAGDLDILVPLRILSMRSVFSVLVKV